MVLVKKYGNALWFYKLPVQTHAFTQSLHGLECCSILVQWSASSLAGSFLVDMCAVILILSLTFDLSRAKTGTVFLRGINHASGYGHTAIPSLDESS